MIIIIIIYALGRKVLPVLEKVQWIPEVHALCMSIWSRSLYRLDGKTDRQKNGCDIPV